jgi:micrococcal nuclease
MYTYHATLVKVVDGDTVDLRIDLGFQVSLNVRARLYGIDTPEIWGVKKESVEYQEGMKAKQFVEEWFSGKETVVVETLKDKQGKYGRWIAKVLSLDSSECLNEVLVEQGLAVEKVY